MAPNESEGGGKRVKAVMRSYRVIGVLREQGTVRINDVADALGVPTSTAHVHLKTLEAAGYVVKDEHGYRLGLRFLRDGSITRGRLDVYGASRSEIKDLAESTGEVANLGVEENGQRVIVYQAEGDKAVYDNAPIGEFTHMHWTALGKAILAELPGERVTEIVDEYGLPTKTDHTISDRDALLEELETIRERGYALEDEERRDGIRSIAVPLVSDGSVIGAVSLSGPKERFNDDRIVDELFPALRDRKNVIEVKYAYD
ncbi:MULTISPECIES: IclR family transcriptional regulator [Haloferax]|uniref:IclR family transcriptional regulator n=2 Tax=Haloferax TaxID=2251 RepID=A0A0K1IY43_HALGI|nr:MULTISPECIES: IclR family transcriptional regulator [Haloferax]AKU09386.1 IclR family transcriptional regulator [Haloferax gibbonsii]ELZ63918.1 IclR family transcriptional regulator [Haloferax prahovense DSM 18310]RDZ40224.1 IclR family transcriptional regulator [Haloferax sp. Atlit-16N]RDZ56848.1 IclR family transcriptional regulator [Haloferax sp. Atlit-10N]